MSEQHKQRTIEHTVMDLIHAKKIRMKPKWYFALSLISSIVAGALAVVVGMLAVNVFLFAFISQGRMASFRLDALLSAYPWWAIVIALVALVIARYLYKKSESSYKHNSITIIGVIVSSILLGAFLLHLFGFDQYMARKGHFRGMYHRYAPRMDGTGPHGGNVMK